MANKKITQLPVITTNPQTAILPIVADPLVTPVTERIAVSDLKLYNNSTPTPITVGGISAGTTFADSSVQEMFDKLLYPYIGPSVSLGASPGGGVREFGNTAASVALSAFTVKHTNPITVVAFYKNSTLLYNVPSPISGGGTENHTDASTLNSNTTYQAYVGDGTTSAGSNVVSYTFVYPYYYGVGAPGLSGAAIAALTKLLITQQNVATSTSPTNQVFYFSYPDAYPALTSILDPNGFETISDYLLRTVTITGLDGSPQTYKVYEFKNLTTQVNFVNTYKY